MKAQRDPSASPAFFDERKAAAVLKHGILRQYLQPFVSKLGSRSPGAAAAFLDGYAGPGVYADGAPGSPGLAAETAARIASFRQLRCFYIEQDRDTSTLGGDWWHAIWRSEAPDREDRILHGYIERLRKAAGGWAHAAIPVAPRAGARPVYVLVFLTQHPEGLWQFAEAVSLARKAWTEFCRLHSPAGPGPGQLAFEGLDEAADEDTEQAWIATIAGNMETLLAEGRPFKVIDKMIPVYGETIGLARSMQVRAAIKRLHKAGKTTTEGKGPRVDQLVVHPAGRPARPSARPASPSARVSGRPA